MLQVICTQLHPGHFSVSDEHSLRCSEEIVKSQIAPFNAIIISSFVFCLGFVHPLQEVALQQCLQLLSVCCFPDPGGSLLPCYVVLPSSAWLSSRSLPSPWLPLCAAFGPHSCYMTSPSPLLFQRVFYDVSYLCSFPDF